jgi:hypothetical protein
MSLIHTCYFSAADPFDYLTQFERNHTRVRAAPGNWMPWNYQQQLARADQSLESSRSPSEHADSFTAPTAAD